MKQILFFIYLTLVATSLNAATHFRCYDPNFNSDTKAFYLDGEDLYVSTTGVFLPEKHYLNPTDMWIYLGNGVFKHTISSWKIKCTATNKKFSKPMTASERQSISICRKAIDQEEYKESYRRKLPKKKKYSLLTSGEFKQSEIDKKYADVVFELDSRAWFNSGLHIVVCLVDLVDREGFVNEYVKYSGGSLPYSIRDWYEVKNK